LIDQQALPGGFARFDAVPAAPNWMAWQKTDWDWRQDIDIARLA